MSRFDKAAEKRITRIVYCAEQLVTKKLKMWAERYDRACAEAKTLGELDEAMRRIDKKFPHMNLKELVEEQRAT